MNRDTSNRRTLTWHRFDIVSFIFGVVFLGVAVTFLANPHGGVALDWTLVAGSLGLAAGAAVIGSLITPARVGNVLESQPDVVLPGPPPRQPPPPQVPDGPDPFDLYANISPEVLEEIQRAAEAEADEAERMPSVRLDKHGDEPMN